MAEPLTIVCIGEALWDVLPAGRVPGGAPMNVARRLTALGRPARLLTRVGDDEAGRELVALMQHAGLDTRWVQIDPLQATGHVTVDTSDPGTPRYRIAAPAAWDFIDAGAYRAAAGDRIDVIVFGSLAARHPVSRGSQARLIEAARLKVLDVNLRPPHDDPAVVDALLSCADWVKLNAAELRQVAAWQGGPARLRAALAWVARRYDLGTVCLTIGEAGALLLRHGRMYEAAGYPARVVDTVGCGDAFLAALLAGLLDDGDPGAALCRACAAGAIVAGSAGGNAEITPAALAALIREPVSLARVPRGTP